MILNRFLQEKNAFSRESLTTINGRHLSLNKDWIYGSEVRIQNPEERGRTSNFELLNFELLNFELRTDPEGSSA